MELVEHPFEDAPAKHTISVMVENRPGVLARISGLFARRGFNINSLAVSATEDSSVSRMTIVTEGSARQLEQIIKQLNKLVDVINILDHTYDDLVSREIALVKLRVPVEKRPEVLQVASVFHAEVASISPKEDTMILELTGEERRIDTFLETLAPYEFVEMVRTGKISLVRGSHLT